MLVEHALTGDSHVVGDSGPGHPSPGWWPGLIGPGAPLDTNHLFVVASNVLGGCQGTTGPSSSDPGGRPWGGRFPFVTIRDQVAAEVALADALGIGRWHGVLGGSMGGMRVLEWVAVQPDRVEPGPGARLHAVRHSRPGGLVPAAAARHPVRPGLPRRRLLRPGRVAGDRHGHRAADRAHHLPARGRARRPVRSPATGRARTPLGGGGRYDVESYLDHHAAKLARRFDPNSYVVLTEAMNSHDVGRGRGGLAAALAGYAGALHVAGVTTDRLYPLRLSEEIAAAHPGSVLSVIESRHGHDGFLVETEQVGGVIARALRDG